MCFCMASCNFWYSSRDYSWSTTFLFYINDIADNLVSNVVLFADDFVLFREVQTREDQLELQNDLIKLTTWSNRWQMTFNPEKCEVMELGRVKRSLSTSYFLNGRKLSVVAKYKHFEVILSTNLSWSSHIDEAVSKARKVWGIIQKITRGANVLAKLQLYKSLVVPLLASLLLKFRQHKPLSSVNVINVSNAILINRKRISVYQALSPRRVPG